MGVNPVNPCEVAVTFSIIVKTSWIFVGSSTRHTAGLRSAGGCRDLWQLMSPHTDNHSNYGLETHRKLHHNSIETNPILTGLVIKTIAPVTSSWLVSLWQVSAECYEYQPAHRELGHVTREPLICSGHVTFAAIIISSSPPPEHSSSSRDRFLAAGGGVTGTLA